MLAVVQYLDPEENVDVVICLLAFMKPGQPCGSYSEQLTSGAGETVEVVLPAASILAEWETSTKFTQVQLPTFIGKINAPGPFYNFFCSFLP